MAQRASVATEAVPESRVNLAQAGTQLRSGEPVTALGSAGNYTQAGVAPSQDVLAVTKSYGTQISPGTALTRAPTQIPLAQAAPGAIGHSLVPLGERAPQGMGNTYGVPMPTPLDQVTNMQNASIYPYAEHGLRWYTAPFIPGPSIGQPMQQSHCGKCRASAGMAQGNNDDVQTTTAATMSDVNQQTYASARNVPTRMCSAQTVTTGEHATQAAPTQAAHQGTCDNTAIYATMNGQNNAMAQLMENNAGYGMTQDSSYAVNQYGTAVPTASLATVLAGGGSPGYTAGWNLATYSPAYLGQPQKYYATGNVCGFQRVSQFSPFGPASLGAQYPCQTCGSAPTPEAQCTATPLSGSQSNGMREAQYSPEEMRAANAAAKTVAAQRARVRECASCNGCNAK